ncbi:MAG: hypothetical protein K9L17_03235 [Clostridiales bacterium]|nr:hypothetical protein [Clostridiales bacterium]MCF8021692.1 hypothetical protein [Clostridiales bacterium]
MFIGWRLFPGKKTIIIILIVLFLSLASYAGINLYWQKNRIPAPELFAAALENTLKINSFRFNINTEYGCEKKSASITGKKSAQGNVYIKGMLQDVPLELVYIEGITYLKEAQTGKWFKLKGNEMINSELFALELNPIKNLKFQEISEVKYEGIDNIDKEKSMLFNVRAKTNNKILNKRYGGFVYKLWIKPKDKLIRKTLITASGLEENDQLRVIIEMYDFNKNICVYPPQENNYKYGD